MTTEEWTKLPAIQAEGVKKACTCVGKMPLIAIRQHLRECDNFGCQNRPHGCGFKGFEFEADMHEASPVACSCVPCPYAQKLRELGGLGWADTDLCQSRFTKKSLQRHLESKPCSEEGCTSKYVIDAVLRLFENAKSKTDAAAKRRGNGYEPCDMSDILEAPGRLINSLYANYVPVDEDVSALREKVYGPPE